MALTRTQNGLLVHPDSLTGSVKLYASLDWQAIIVDPKAYVGTAVNSTGALGRIIGVNTAKTLVQLLLLKPIYHSGNVLPSYTAWADIKQLSEYNPQNLDYTAMNYYYSTGDSVRIRSTASLVNTNNVIGKADKGDLLGKYDGFIETGFFRIYPLNTAGGFLVDKSGNRIVRYVHKDYASTVNPKAQSSTNPTAPEINEPNQDNGTVEIFNQPQTAANSAGIAAAIGLGIMALGLAVANYVRNRIRKTPKKP